MNDLLVCKFNNCNKFYLNPVVLSCSKNACKYHIDQLLDDGKQIFNCNLCLNEHHIPEEGFLSNDTLNDIINLNLHLNHNETRAKDIKSKLDESINELLILKKNPIYFIYDYISRIRIKIDLERDMLIDRIHTISDNMFDRLNAFENECYKNYNEKLSDLNGEIDHYLSKLKYKWTDLNDELRTPNNKDINKIIDDINLTMKYIDFKIINFQNMLLNNKGCNLNISDTNIDSLFGVLDINESINIKSIDFKKDFGLFNSSILTSEQAIDLFRLCEFDNEENFRIIYKASIDGFKSMNFHNKCDGIENTLTIVKVKDSKHIFGGFTSAKWNSLDEWLHDKNSFIFSLVNNEDTPLKMKVENFKCAVYNNPEYGPTFGGGCDFKIISDSNIYAANYSRLGCSYKHPKYESGSNESFCFLAGSHLFKIEEIEVYKLFKS